MPAGKRKKRIRKHVIADLSFHHVAYRVVKCGFTIEATRSDYGYDGSIFTYNRRGEVENGTIFFQLKATDHIARYKKRTAFSFPIEKRDVDLWKEEPFPVYLILFDTASEVAYWLYFQAYLEINGVTAAMMSKPSLPVRMNAAQIVDVTSVRAWRGHKAKVLANIGLISHA
jgi:hypothetical protein